MAEDLEKQYEESNQTAERHFRKDVKGFRTRRLLELEDLLRTEREKPLEFQDQAKIQWLLEELQDLGGEG